MGIRPFTNDWHARMAIFWKWPRQPGFRLVTRIFKGVRVGCGGVFRCPYKHFRQDKVVFCDLVCSLKADRQASSGMANTLKKNKNMYGYPEKRGFASRDGPGFVYDK